MTASLDDLQALGPDVTVINAGRAAGSQEIRGAIRYRPSDLLHAQKLALPIASDIPVIVYAAHGPEDDLHAIADKLRRDVAPDVRILDATLDAYVAGGGETQAASLEQVVPPHAPAEVQELDRRA